MTKQQGKPEIPAQKRGGNAKAYDHEIGQESEKSKISLQVLNNGKGGQSGELARGER